MTCSVLQQITITFDFYSLILALKFRASKQISRPSSKGHKILLVTYNRVFLIQTHIFLSTIKAPDPRSFINQKSATLMESSFNEPVPYRTRTDNMAQQSFQELFGGATAQVNYNDTRDIAQGQLPLPEPTDNLEVTDHKLRALAKVVEHGASIAVATGYKPAAHEQRDPEELARKRMTPEQTAQYDSWKSGIEMPDFDWANNHKAVPKGASSAICFANWARAIAEIWNHADAQAEHASWIASNMTYALPLVVAVAKVHAAQRELKGGQDEISEIELAEMQTAHKAVAVAMENVHKVNKCLNELNRSLNRSREILQAREHQIKAKMTNKKRKGTHN